MLIREKTVEYMSELYKKLNQEPDSSLREICKEYERLQKRPWFDRTVMDVLLCMCPDRIEYEVAQRVLREREKRAGL